MKLIKEYLRTKILERLDELNLDLINFEYNDSFNYSFTTKCKECGTIKEYKRIGNVTKCACLCDYVYDDKQHAIENVSKCKTLKEFRENYPKDYDWFQRNGLLKEMTSHLKRGHCKIERLIYVYEIYIEGMKPHAYIGLTYNLEIRDKDHLHGGERDSLWRFCKEHNVAMPKPKILMDYVPEDKASQMEAFYEKQYRERGFETINVKKCGGLGGGTPHTFEEIEKIGKKYFSRGEWKNNDGASYNYAYYHYKKIKGKNVRWLDLIIPTKNLNKEKIIAINTKTKERRIYKNIFEVKKDGFKRKRVCNVCLGKNNSNTHKGWIFRYIIDGEIKNTNGKTKNIIEGKTNKKPVIAINIKTKETRIYESMCDAEKDGFTCSAISAVCRGKLNKHKGWIFQYIEDGEIENVA